MLESGRPVLGAFVAPASLTVLHRCFEQLQELEWKLVRACCFALATVVADRWRFQKVEAEDGPPQPGLNPGSNNSGSLSGEGGDREQQQPRNPGSEPRFNSGRNPGSNPGSTQVRTQFDPGFNQV